MRTAKEIALIVEQALRDTYNEELIEYGYEVILTNDCEDVEICIYPDSNRLDGIGEIYKSLDCVSDNIVRMSCNVDDGNLVISFEFINS